MRMWMVNPKWMCQQHLLGEHVECHMFLGTLLKGISVDGYINRNLFEFKSLQSRHDELAKELEARGMTHNSPLARFPQGGFTFKIMNSKIDREEASAELFGRCPECLKKKKEVIETEHKHFVNC